MQAIQFSITPEQVAYARELVQYSIDNHTVWNSWTDASQTYRYRFAGTLCEVIFADAYGLQRPARAFGANDGQDYGEDFVLDGYTIDIKGRVTEIPQLYSFYINASQAERENTKTDYYYFMHCYPESAPAYCLLLGSVKCEDVRTCAKSVRRRKGETMGNVIWDNDVFDVSLSNLRAPRMPKNAPALPNIRIINYQ